MSRPVFAVPADVELELDPIRPDWVIEGTPQVRSKYLARSADGASSVMAWSCTAGRFIWCYKVDEMLHVISGEVFVTDEKGAVRRLGPGDMAFFPAGARSVWHVPHEVRKLAMCRHKMPRPFGTLLRVVEQSDRPRDRLFGRRGQSRWTRVLPTVRESTQVGVGVGRATSTWHH